MGSLFLALHGAASAEPRERMAGRIVAHLATRIDEEKRAAGI